MEQREGSNSRLQQAVTAIGTGLLLDLADLITFGPIGVWTGLALGGVLGWILAPQLGYGRRPWLPAIAAGLYCMTPGTALLPAAGLLAAVRAFSSSDAPRAPAPPGRPADRNAIAAHYESRWDDDQDTPRD